MNKISAHLLVVQLNDIYDVFQTASTWSVAVIEKYSGQSVKKMGILFLNYTGSANTKISYIHRVSISFVKCSDMVYLILSSLMGFKTWALC